MGCLLSASNLAIWKLADRLLLTLDPLLFFVTFGKRSSKQSVFLMRESTSDFDSYLVGPQSLGYGTFKTMLLFYVHSIDYLSEGSNFIKLLIQVSEKNCRKRTSDYLEVTHYGTI